MKIIIAAGTGFLGQALEKYFTTLGHEIIILTRAPKQSNHLLWDAKTIGQWSVALEGADVLINMAGKSVDCRYTEHNRNEILSSRVDSTLVLQHAINRCTKPPAAWLNASSATIYIHAETTPQTEATGTIGDDFSMNICKQWEAAFFQSHLPQIRKVALRTSIVLGDDGGAYPKMKLISRLGLGGRQGQGRQMMSYIWIDDFCRAVEYIIQNDTLSGPINITHPLPIPNALFMSRLRLKTKGWFAMPSPTWLLELAAIFVRTETELLLKSRFVVPQKLIDHGFVFEEEM
jgi:uncharacterized protein